MMLEVQKACEDVQVLVDPDVLRVEGVRGDPGSSDPNDAGGPEGVREGPGAGGPGCVAHRPECGPGGYSSPRRAIQM